MRCNDCDAHMDEMLSGILHPDANQHLRQCERCTSHYRARASVQNSLRKLASASPSGPSAVTDRAVMESYRRLQQRRAAWASEPVLDAASDSAVASAAAGSASSDSSARLFTFPSRNLTPVWGSRTWWTGAAAAAVVFAVFGSAVHLWTGLPSVSAPIIATAPAAIAPSAAPAASVPSQSASVGDSSRPSGATANASSRPGSAALAPERSARLSSRASQSGAPSEVAKAAFRATAPSPVLTARTAPARPSLAYGEGSTYDSSPVTQLSPGVSPVIHLASSGSASNVAQSASSTWPGYSNLMYCDPVVCSGPMQVVHIKVPVGQVKPNLGQTVGNAFVNAEVVIGPDGVARAIRVAN